MSKICKIHKLRYKQETHGGLCAVLGIQAGDSSSRSSVLGWKTLMNISTHPPDFRQWVINHAKFSVDTCQVLGTLSAKWYEPLQTHVKEGWLSAAVLREVRQFPQTIKKFKLVNGKVTIVHGPILMHRTSNDSDGASDAEYLYTRWTGSKYDDAAWVNSL